MDETVINLYRKIYNDNELDWEENLELITFLIELNPPPDKILWLRSTAFRIGCEFLSEDGNKDHNVALLRSMNGIVHAIEKNCLIPKEFEGSDVVEYDASAVDDFYQSLFGNDLLVDNEENQELYKFLQTNRPAISFYTTMRVSVFKVGCNHLSEKEDSKKANMQLLRCINCVVDAIEKSYLKPKEFQMKVDSKMDFASMSINDAVQKLWEIDVNRLKPNVDYKMNVQKGKKPYLKGDFASDPLFDYVDRDVFRRPTYKTFLALCDNYTPEVGKKEVVTRGEMRENWNFLEAIMQSQPMQFCHKFCHQKNPDLVPASAKGFKEILYKLWFKLYKRSRGGSRSTLDSSGFEHVFIGEIKDEKVTGFHNWINFYNEEKKGNVDYRGYVKPRGSNNAAQTNENDHLLSLQFKWHGVEKFVSTSFIGVSPEFEIALYTMCFLLSADEETMVDLDTGTGDIFKMKIKCYRFGDGQIGTSFPEMVSHHED